MDFSLVDVNRIQWSIPLKNKSQCLQKIRFQAPRACIKLVPCPKFDGALELSVDDSRFPCEFHDFLDRLIESVPKDMIEAKMYYDPWKRLTAFDDVIVFDAEEHIIKNAREKKGYHEASLLLQVDGLWLSERSWGFRFRVIQLKLHAENIKALDKEPPVRILVEGKPYLFMRDD